jgi:hypothetical protein
LLNSVVSIFNAGAAAAAGDYESIATVTVGSTSVSSISFTTIGTDWAHLQVRAFFRMTQGNAIGLRLNSDTGSNYSDHDLSADGSSVYTNAGTSTSYIQLLPVTGTTATANIGNVMIIDLLDYDNTNKYKTVRVLSGHDTNGGGAVAFDSGSWRNTNAVTGIELFPVTAGRQFAQYSHFALYGIKGA